MEVGASVDVLRLYMASMTAFMDQEQELKNATDLYRIVR